MRPPRIYIIPIEDEIITHDFTILPRYHTGPKLSVPLDEWQEYVIARTTVIEFYHKYHRKYPHLL